MLAGSGGTIAAHFTPNLIVIGAAAGIVCGILAMFGPAARLVRDGPLASMASVGGVQRARTIPMWPLIVGAGLLAAAVVLLKIFERGSLPLSMGINGLTVGLCGVVLVTVWIAPRAAGLSSGLLTNVRPAVGRLLGADIRRYTLLFALSAALLAESTSLAIGSNSMQLLGTEQIAAQKADRLPAALLISAQSVLDQRDGRLSDSTFELVTGAADGRSVSSHWQSTISSGTLSRQVVGVTPGDWYSQALYRADRRPRQVLAGLARRRGRPDRDCRQPARRCRGRHRRTAHRRRAEAVTGWLESSVHRWSMTPQWATSCWSPKDWRVPIGLPYATRSRWPIRPPPTRPPTASDFLNLGAGLFVYDNEQWRSVATNGITRFLQPLTFAGVRSDGSRRPERAERVRAGTCATQA